MMLYRLIALAAIHTFAVVSIRAEELIGEGSRAKVYVLNDSRFGSGVYARKEFRREHHDDYDRELHALTLLRDGNSFASPHLIGSDASTKSVFIELIRPATDFWEYWSRADLEKIRFILAQVVVAAEDISRQGVFHGDIQAKKLLMEHDRLHLLDYGLSEIRSVSKAVEGNMGWIQYKIFNTYTIERFPDAFPDGMPQLFPDSPQISISNMKSLSLFDGIDFDRLECEMREPLRAFPDMTIASSSPHPIGLPLILTIPEAAKFSSSCRRNYPQLWPKLIISTHDGQEVYSHPIDLGKDVQSVDTSSLGAGQYVHAVTVSNEAYITYGLAKADLQHVTYIDVDKAVDARIIGAPFHIGNDARFTWNIGHVNKERVGKLLILTRPDGSILRGIDFADKPAAQGSMFIALNDIGNIHWSFEVAELGKTIQGSFDVYPPKIEHADATASKSGLTVTWNYDPTHPRSTAPSNGAIKITGQLSRVEMLREKKVNLADRKIVIPWSDMHLLSVLDERMEVTVYHRYYPHSIFATVTFEYETKVTLSSGKVGNNRNGVKQIPRTILINRKGPSQPQPSNALTVLPSYLSGLTAFFVLLLV